MSLKPTPEELNQQAEIYLSEGKLEEAEAVCRQALAVKGDFAPACKTLGNIMQLKGEIEGAEIWYLKAIEIWPQWAEVRANLGSVYGKQQQWEKAKACYEEAIEIKPNFAGFYRNLIKLCQQAGSPDLATEYSLRAQILEPEKARPKVYKELGDVLVKQGKLEAAIGCYQKQLEMQPNNWRVCYNLGDALLKIGKVDEAIATLQRGRKIYPKFPLFDFTLGDALSKKEELESAILAYRRAVELKPDNAFFHRRLQWALETRIRNKGEGNKGEGNKGDRSEKTIFFSIIPVAAGFTDQLLQFMVFYKLGLSLGYPYIHTNFYSNRSSKQIYDFLGFNQFWSANINNIDLSEYELMYLGFDNNNLKKLNEINNLAELQDYCRDIIANTAREKEKIIVIFRLKGISKARLKLLSIINSEIEDYQDSLNLRKIYFDAAGVRSKPNSYFKADRVKLLIHIRAGDIATIKTPWGDFIRSMKSIQDDRVKTGKSLDKVKWLVKEVSAIAPEDYYRFSRDLISGLGAESVSTCVFSDGYERAFDFIKGNLNNIKLTPEKTKQIIDLSQSYETEEFSIFNNMENCSTAIGESDEKLFDLIDSCLMAEIFIIGNRQRMIPKFLANYYNPQKQPLIFVLSKNKKRTSVIKTYARDLTLDSRKATVIPVNLEDYKIEELIEIAKEKVGMKH